jgi:hypothetical protein
LDDETVLYLIQWCRTVDLDEGQGDLLDERVLMSLPDCLIDFEGQVQPISLSSDASAMELPNVLRSAAAVGDFISVTRTTIISDALGPGAGLRSRLNLEGRAFDPSRIRVEASEVEDGIKGFLYAADDGSILRFEENRREEQEEGTSLSALQEWEAEDADDDDEELIYLPRVHHQTLYFNREDRIVEISSDEPNEFESEGLGGLRYTLKQNGVDLKDVAAVREFMLSSDE